MLDDIVGKLMRSQSLAISDYAIQKSFQQRVFDIQVVLNSQDIERLPGSTTVKNTHFTQA